MASRGVKTYSESRIELRNPQILKVNDGNVRPEQPCEPKRLDVALNIVGVKEYARKTCGCGPHGKAYVHPRSNARDADFRTDGKS